MSAFINLESYFVRGNRMAQVGPCATAVFLAIHSLAVECRDPLCRVPATDAHLAALTGLTVRSVELARRRLIKGGLIRVAELRGACLYAIQPIIEPWTPQRPKQTPSKRAQRRLDRRIAKIMRDRSHAAMLARMSRV